MHEVVYGISKFLNGMLADVRTAILMSTALLVSAGLNICFGLSSAAIFFGIFWMLNGLFQGMGYPPCARLLTHWFGPKELATKMSIWNASHSIGGGLIVILCGFLIDHFGHEHWRLCFFVPSAIAMGMAALLFLNLRDTPESIICRRWRGRIKAIRPIRMNRPRNSGNLFGEKCSPTNISG